MEKRSGHSELSVISWMSTVEASSEWGSTVILQTVVSMKYNAGFLLLSVPI